MTFLHEWPLVLFTLMVQLAVGLHLALLATKSLPRAGDPAGRLGSLRENPALLVGLLMAGALVVSLLHLGAPLEAVHTLSNLEESWLSREILAVLVFLSLWGVGYGLGTRPGPAPGTLRAFSWATALVGIVLIGIMTRIYMVPARPLWDHWLTAAGFLLTTLLLGATAGAAYLERPLGTGAVTGAASLERLSTGRAGAPPAASRRGGALLAVGLTASLAQVGATLAHPVAADVMESPGGISLAGLRLLLLVGGAFLLVVPLARSAFPGRLPSRPSTSQRWAVAALLLLGVSEVVGRALFYAVGPEIPF